MLADAKFSMYIQMKHCHRQSPAGVATAGAVNRWATLLPNTARLLRRAGQLRAPGSYYGKAPLIVSHKSRSMSNYDNGSRCCCRPLVIKGSQTHRRSGESAANCSGGRLCRRDGCRCGTTSAHRQRGGGSLRDRPQWAKWVTSARRRREDRSSISSDPLADLGREWYSSMSLSTRRGPLGPCRVFAVSAGRSF